MNTNFDSKLREIPHYKRYPAMIPFVGDHYESPEHRKLLLVGGNFYFKNEEVDTVPDADAWYKGSQDFLCKEHIGRIDCRGLVGGNWEPEKEYRVYRNINKAIKLVGFGTVKKDEIRGIDHVAFMNAFQRLSKFGETDNEKKEELAQIDIDVGSDVIKRVIDILEPDCVVFVHKRGWDEFHSSIDTAVKPTIRWVRYAGHSRWWKQSGEAEFIKILKEFKN